MRECGKMKRLLAAALAAVACTLSGPVLRAAAVDAESVRQAQKIVETVRGRRFLRPVPAATVSRTRLKDLLAGKFREGLPVAPEVYFRCLARIGAIDASDLSGLEDRLLSFYETQVLAFYDPAAGTFYVSDAAQEKLGAMSGPEEELIFTHELTHALQDEHLSLQSRLEALRSNGDEALALDGLLEGEATEVMVEGALRDLPAAGADVEALLSPLLTSSLADLEPDAPPIPEFFQRQLFFPYTEGTAYVRYAKKNGGGWRAIDRLWASPPTSTSEILHRSISWRPATGLLPGDGGIPLPHGARFLFSDTLGEWSLRFLFRRWSVPDADELASSWRGDRIAFFAQGGRIGFLAVLQAADEPSARRVLDAWRSAPPAPRGVVRGNRVVLYTDFGDPPI
jgi:hypothetical protein